MTVVDRVRADLRVNADAPAVIEAGRVWTHAEFFDRVDRLSNAYQALGVTKGDRILCWLGNQHEALEAEMACLQIGAVWVTLNAGLTWAEVQSVIESTEPRLAVSRSDLLARTIKIDERVGELLRTCSLIRVGDPVDNAIEFSETVEFEDAIAAASSDRPGVVVSEDDIARLRYTSGTTGQSKAAILSHRAYLGSLANLKEHLHALSQSDRVLHAGPLTHASAAMAYPILEAGGANVILPHFDTDAVLETIAREHVTCMFAVPTMLRRLIASPDIDLHDLRSLKTISYGGAPMPVEHIEDVIRRLGPVLMQIYGLTEAVHPVTCLKREAHRPGNPKLGSAGTLTSSCAIEIRREDASLCESGETGEIHVRGSITFSGYWRDDIATAETLQDGWVATGDLGYCDDDGYYWIAGRKKDVIISGGFNVYASEIEMVLLAHSDVCEAAVVGVADPDWGEAVTAVVHSEDHAAIDAEALHAHCRERLAAYKCPKRFVVMEEPLPKNSAGKIAKNAVRALLAETASLDRAEI